jgi:hypothetical protein
MKKFIIFFILFLTTITYCNADQVVFQWDRPTINAELVKLYRIYCSLTQHGIYERKGEVISEILVTMPIEIAKGSYCYVKSADHQGNESVESNTVLYQAIPPPTNLILKCNNCETETTTEIKTKPLLKK